MRRGLFITFEGIDGAGKGTHVQSVREYYEKLGHEVVTTREPGGTELGEKLRHILISDQMDYMSEVLMLMTGRNEHLAKVIRPAMARGAVVICERFTDSTLAFQCGGRGMDARHVLAAAAVVHGDLWPDLTIVFDVDPDIAAARMDGRTLDKFEAEEVIFHQNVTDYYAKPSNFPYPHRLHYVDARESIDAVQQSVLRVLSTWVNPRD